MKYLALGIALALGSVAFALPTLQGPTGGLEVPTAAVQSGWTVAVDHIEGSFLEIPLTRVLVGVTPNLEVGALYAKDFDTLWAVNAKFGLPLDLVGGGLAIGAVYADIGALNPWAVYLSGTWAVLGDTALTVNVTRSDDDAGTKDTFFGVALENQLGDASAGIEWLFGLEGVSNYGNVFVTYAINENISARLALTGINQATQLVIGAAYTFGN